MSKMPDSEVKVNTNRPTFHLDIARIALSSIGASWITFHDVKWIY